MEFTFTQMKQLKEIADGNFDAVRDAICDGWDSDIRIIHRDEIDEAMKEELESDPYTLGCFNASFLADIETLNLDREFIEKLQESEAFEAIGELIIRTPGALEEIVEDYARLDGYGHHFSHYDGDEHEVGNYYAFRIN